MAFMTTTAVGLKAAARQSAVEATLSTEVSLLKRKQGHCLTCEYIAKDNTVDNSSFLEQIAFFMPIFQEPMTFDFVRHRSSFLLSTILAIAAKYNSTSTTRHNATGGEAAEPFGWDPLGSSGRNGVKPVDEDKWFEIRSLALSSYFQALISKVHCLGGSIKHQRTTLC